MGANVAGEPLSERWQRYRRALGGQPLPAALVDLEALEENAGRLHAIARAGGKKIRLATKSIRVPELLRRLVDLAGADSAGLMTYAASETAFLASEGHGDLLLAYPTAQPSDAALLAEAARKARVSVVCDSPEHLDALEPAARAAGVRIGVVVEVDLSLRAAGGRLHLGVRRSPLRTADDVVALARRVAERPSLEFSGVMGYEAQIAGVTDKSPFSPLLNAPKRAIKLASRRDVEARRTEIARALERAGMAARIFNGGGSGSLAWACGERDLTEVTVGSGYLDSHLFSYYRDLSLVPAAYFALQVVRRPAPGLVTCHGGGYVASGEAGPDRLPLPALPEGAKLLSFEGAGEVQTPVALPESTRVELGDPIFFRHAKAGELAEHFNEYLLVREGKVEGRARTYRGLGHCFLG